MRPPGHQRSHCDALPFDGAASAGSADSAASAENAGIAASALEYTLRCALASVVLLTSCATTARADLAERAIVDCNRSDTVAPAERPEIIAMALKLAEASVDQTPSDPRAHYAVFCALAKRVRHNRASLRALSDLRRMRARVDHALMLDPDYAVANAAKGAYLYYLPRLLGGNAQRGLELLERSIALDPDNPATRLIYADVLADRGDHAAGRLHTQRGAF